MKRTLWLGNLVLLAVIGLVGHEVWRRNREAVVYQQKVLAAKPKPKMEAVTLPAAVPPATPQTYFAETVQHLLFSPDRNPNVVVKVVQKPPEPVMPPLPAAYGLMFFGDPVLLLASGPGKQRGYHPGEQVGEFTLVDFDDENVTFQWRDKTVEQSLAELMKLQKSQPDKSPAATTVAPGADPLKPVASNTAAAPAQASVQGVPGVAFSPTQRACLASDSTPAGTVSSDGYKKVIDQRGMFGDSCSWVKQ